MESRQLAKWLRYYGVFTPLARLPFPWAYRSAGLIGRYDRWRNANARLAIAMGLKKGFPQEAANPQTLNRWLAGYFGMMARETMDVFCMPRLNRDNVDRVARLRPESLDVLHAARRGGRGVILVMCHFSRLNMLLLSLALAGERLGMITMAVDERNPDLDPVDRVYLNTKIGTLLKFLGGRWVCLGDSMRGVYAGLRSGETMVILLDAHTPGLEERNKLRLPFLGGTLEIPRGIERLAEKTGAALVYGVARERGWGIDAELRPLPDPPDQGLRQAVAELERDVNETPWQWWQWCVLDYLWSPTKTEDRT